MDQRDKQDTRERHERFLKKHYRTRDEEKRIQEEARQRKAMRRTGEEAETEEDDPDPFQKIDKVAKRRTAGMDPSRIDAMFASVRDGGAPRPMEPRATVVAVHRTLLRIRAEAGDRAEIDLPLPLRGPVPVVGDLVTFERGDRGPGKVIALAERRTLLARGDGAGGERVLAANVDLAVIVAAVREPGLRPGLIDRIVVALAQGGVEPLIALNKADLVPDAAERAGIAAAIEPLTSSGIGHLWVSAVTGEGVDDLRASLRGRTCVLVGHSGVGKTSLLNVIEPTHERATGSGRAFDGKGRHTTSSSCLVELEDGTRIIDTPGVRSFALAEPDRDSVAEAFPDVAQLAGRCRFRDCTHSHEPECAVLAALADGRLSSERLDAYRRLTDSP